MKDEPIAYAYRYIVGSLKNKRENTDPELRGKSGIKGRIFRAIDFSCRCRSVKYILSIMKEKRSRKFRQHRIAEHKQLNIEPAISGIVVFGSGIPEFLNEDGHVFLTDDLDLLLRLLDAEKPIRQLIFRRPEPKLLMRLDRLLMEGVHLVWCPENGWVPPDRVLMEFIRTRSDTTVDRPE